MGIIYNSVPVGSLVTLPAARRRYYIDRVLSLPRTVRDMLFSPRTGAFTRGLAKGYGLPEKKSSRLALATLRIAVGEKTLAQLPSVLSTELRLANDQAQKMAQEIEEGLFKPVVNELNVYLEKKRGVGDRPITQSGGVRGVRNVLDLKNQKGKRLQPPPMPKGRG